jgi:parallel beta-helix repeat protein
LKRFASKLVLSLFICSLLFAILNIQKVKANPEVITVDNDRVECPDADFTSIQEAVNAANPGDTICVYSGIYYENLVVNKTVSLIGQGPRLTLIFNGDRTRPVIYVTANNTVIRGFGIQEGASPPSMIGIYIHNASGNDITYNIIGSNYIGIYLNYSNNNKIYHNNFLGNTVQAYAYNSFSNMWDDGYPCGGNYWDDHVIIEWIPELFGGGKRLSGPGGVDLYCGPYQNETGGDGISDVPYTINADNEDRYPLMGLVNLFIDGWLEVPGWINMVSNSTVSDLYFNPDEGAFIKFNVTGEEGTIGYCKAVLPKEVLWAENNQWTVLIDGEPVDPRITEDTGNTYLYFTYNHSTKTVEIQGTDAIPEFSTWTPMLLLFVVLTIASVIYKRRLHRNPINAK